MFLHQERHRWYLQRCGKRYYQFWKIARNSLSYWMKFGWKKLNEFLLPLRIEYRMCGTELFSYLFAKFAVEIITISEVGFTKIESMVVS